MIRRKNARGTMLNPSNRRLKVGEEIRHALSTILLRRDFQNAEDLSQPVTVTEVRLSADLKQAHVFVISMGGKDRAKMLNVLEENTPAIRRRLGQLVEMRYLPQLKFKIDESFDEAERIQRLLNTPQVKRDTHSDDE